VVGVNEIAIAFMLAVERFSNSITIFGLDVLPVLERTIHRDSAGTRGLWRPADAFESAHPARQLIVIIITVASAHRLAIAAVFLGIFIYEETAGMVAIL